MKQFIILVFFISLLSTSMLAQTTHTILLEVNTAAVSNTNARDHSRFDGQAPNTNPEEYTVYVDVGDTIIFRGMSSSNSEHTVQIKSINHQGGDNVFDKNVLRDTQQQPGIVQGVVMQGTEEFVQKYKIMFRIDGDGRPGNRMYFIDPKIEVRKAR